MKSVLLAIFLLISYGLTAQVYTGGNAGVNVDNNNLYVDIAPIIGYRINSFNVGLSPVISYRRNPQDDETYSYGARIFSEYTLFKGFFLHAEAEALNVEDFANRTPEGDTTRDWILAVPLGAGYRQPIGDRITAHAMILYDVIEDERSPYENPLVRAGINYNF